MDSFFPEKLLGEIFWDQPLLPTDQSDVVQNSHIKAEAFPPATQSAFLQYRDLPRRNNPLNGSNSESMSKRMLAFLRKSSPVERNNTDNNSVIQTAAKEIVRLKGCREELQRKICEAEGVCVRKKDGGRKIAYLRVADPECGIDSMVERLKWLKEEGVESRRIKSSFSPKELFAVLEIESGEEV
ncbi:hypothetical protein LR48_Vigan02g000500 [Vigna angularis]|uniref:BHLH domain-containing protein n=1 Tax=Phaseolus angularis TaxID=3914 RepID=A0A0L9TTI6_PHAAN|nr:hypothetical protein LR48_Vigan02g000500 [Vigna angularis]